MGWINSSTQTSSITPSTPRRSSIHLKATTLSCRPDSSRKARNAALLHRELPKGSRRRPRSFVLGRRHCLRIRRCSARRLSLPLATYNEARGGKGAYIHGGTDSLAVGERAKQTSQDYLGNSSASLHCKQHPKDQRRAGNIAGDHHSTRRAPGAANSMQTLLTPPRNPGLPSEEEEIDPNTGQRYQYAKYHAPSVEQAARATDAFMGWPQDRGLSQRPIAFGQPLPTIAIQPPSTPSILTMEQDTQSNGAGCFGWMRNMMAKAFRFLLCDRRS